VRNTQRIYISRSFDDIQVQNDMHLQEASFPVAGDEDFIIQETPSISSKAQVGVQ
jgi:hypothetical protein